MSSLTVAVLGASPNAERYSNKAVAMLLEHGHDPIPVHPTADAIHGRACVKSLGEIKKPVDTLTMYVGEAISNGQTDAILALKPRRIIFNPGAENPALAKKAEAAGIQTEDACTLVLLSSGQF